MIKFAIFVCLAGVGGALAASRSRTTHLVGLLLIFAGLVVLGSQFLIYK